jgi:hypothetical protein
MTAFGQQSDNTPRMTCSVILNRLTAEWENDSLGTTGYRAQYFELLRQCRPDSITKTFLFDKLGKPSSTRKIAYGKPWRNHIEYVYYISNVDLMAKKRPFEGFYIAFVFDEDEKFLEEIIDGDFCG